MSFILSFCFSQNDRSDVLVLLRGSDTPVCTWELKTRTSWKDTGRKNKKEPSIATLPTVHFKSTPDTSWMRSQALWSIPAVFMQIKKKDKTSATLKNQNSPCKCRQFFDYLCSLHTMKQFANNCATIEIGKTEKGRGMHTIWEMFWSQYKKQKFTKRKEKINWREGVEEQAGRSRSSHALQVIDDGSVGQKTYCETGAWHRETARDLHKAFPP